MKKDSLEAQILRLRPAAMPDDLMARLQEPPAPGQSRRNRKKGLWSAAAVLVLGLSTLWMLRPKADERVAAHEDSPVSVVREDTVLLSSKVVATREHEGRVWELVEERWRDELIGVCSATPVRVRLTEIRPELVWIEVKYL